MQSIPALLRMFLQVLRNNHNLQWSCLKRPSWNTLHPEKPTGVLVYMSDLGLSVATHHRLDASVSRCICAPLHANVSSLSEVARFSQLVNLTQVRFSQVGILFFLRWVHYLFWAIFAFWKAEAWQQMFLINICVLSQRGDKLSHLASILKWSVSNPISKKIKEKQISS